MHSIGALFVNLDAKHARSILTEFFAKCEADQTLFLIFLISGFETIIFSNLLFTLIAGVNLQCQSTQFFILDFLGKIKFRASSYLKMLLSTMLYISQIHFLFFEPLPPSPHPPTPIPHPAGRIFLFSVEQNTLVQGIFWAVSFRPSVSTF